MVKSEGAEDREREREKGWVLGETRGQGERGGEQAHGLLWVPKERMGPERGVERGAGGGSPSLFPSPLSLSFVPANHEASQQKRGVASPSMVYLGDTKSFLGDTKLFLGDAKLYGGGRAGGTAAGGGGGGEKQSQTPPQQFAGGGGGTQEGKGGATKEESQSLLRVSRFFSVCFHYFMWIFVMLPSGYNVYHFLRGSFLTKSLTMKPHFCTTSYLLGALVVKAPPLMLFHLQVITPYNLI